MPSYRALGASLWLAFDEAVYRLMLASIGGMGLGFMACGAYLIKSELGIKITEAHSPLHPIFFG